MHIIMKLWTGDEPKEIINNDDVNLNVSHLKCGCVLRKLFWKYFPIYFVNNRSWK